MSTYAAGHPAVFTIFMVQEFSQNLIILHIIYSIVLYLMHNIVYVICILNPKIRLLHIEPGSILK